MSTDLALVTLSAGDSPSPTRERSSTSSRRATSPAANARSRPWLYFQASIWRFLGNIGFWFHNFPHPSPPPPSFLRQFPTTTVGRLGPAAIELAFYVPKEYEIQKRQGKKYPVVVNLHGGGFTMGTSRDDARWAALVLKEVDAIVVSVEYRLAPEYPFPTAVEDGVEALLHLAANAEDFGIDPTKMALSGFSAGGNMSFTIPLRLQTHLQSIRNEIQSKSISGSRPAPSLPNIVSIVSWYPSLDYRLTRAERRAVSVRPDKTLPPCLANLFDQAYLPEAIEHRASPFLSPSAASDEALRNALPEGIAMFLCEWDMLLQEGKDFATRLESLGKHVQCTIMPKKIHGFDKSPSPFSLDPKIMLYYKQACEVLRESFSPVPRAGSQDGNVPKGKSGLLSQ